MEFVRILRGKPLFVMPQPYGYLVFWGRGLVITAIYVAAFSYHLTHGGLGAVSGFDMLGYLFALTCMSFLVMSIERNDDFKKREEKKTPHSAPQGALGPSKT